MKKLWLKRALLGSIVLIASPMLAVAALWLIEPLPAALAQRQSSQSLRLYDRSGRLIRELRTREGRLAMPARLSEMSPHVVPALIAAEDARFYSHRGVDPLAMARALGQALRRGRVVSGGSTLTQQLARAVVPRERTLFGKLRELAIALRIESELEKPQILEEYLTRIEFGPNLVGIESASRRYFDKPAKDLSLGEAATLVAMVRGPTFYDPRKGLGRLEGRKRYVLDRLQRSKRLSESVLDRARREPIRPRRTLAEGGALHFALALGAGALRPAPEAPLELWTTLDLDLQREVEAIATRTLDTLDAVDATALSVLVVENATGDVVAYVGSPNYFAVDAEGKNDGTRALRQPGSTLKPFVYAAAMERLGWTPATLLSDLGLEIATPEGRYRPRNYDGREHGPVRLRVALGSSLNLPALRAAEELGPPAVLEMLHRFGFASLTREPAHYGAAIALGDGEVRLTELAQAYATLAREGEFLPLRFASRARFADGGPVELERSLPRRVLSASIARQLTDILADDAARSPMFGAESVLSFPFPAASKTGTSKGFRDNWAVSYTKEVTVAVWVGNFDGRPLLRSSGVSGAGPLLHATLLASMRKRARAPLVPRQGFVEQTICGLSGAVPGKSCPVRLRERFLAGQAPIAHCAFHEPARAQADAASGPTERYPERFTAWAHAAGRPLASEGSVVDPLAQRLEPGIEWPRSGTRFVLDPERSLQEIVVQGRGLDSAEPLVLHVDGRPAGSATRLHQVTWRLTPGRHVLTLMQGKKRSSQVLVEVAWFTKNNQRERL